MVFQDYSTNPDKMMHIPNLAAGSSRLKSDRVCQSFGAIAHW